MAEAFGTVVGTATSRLPDGTEVAWAVHATMNPEADEDEDEDIVTVLGASESTPRPLLLRFAPPLSAMAIVRSLCHRDGALLSPGRVVWLHPNDVSMLPFFERPPAFLVLAPEEIESASAEVFVAAPIAWAEVSRPIEELRALVLSRNAMPPALEKLDGKRLQEIAKCMIRVMCEARDTLAVDVASHGLSTLVEKGLGKALTRPLTRVLLEGSATTQAREAAAHLLVDAGEPWPVLDLVVQPGMHDIALTAARRALHEELPCTPIEDALELGLPEGWELDDTDERLSEFERSVAEHTDTWVARMRARSRATPKGVPGSGG